jgi:hypothetical protein
MSEETDKQFVERMIAETPVLHSLNTERLLALALRGAETQQLVHALELIAGKHGPFSMPWPEAALHYGTFAFMTARDALTALGEPSA